MSGGYEGVAAEVVDRGLQINLADPVESADEEGVDGDQGAGVRALDVAFAELGRESF